MSRLKSRSLNNMPGVAALERPSQSERASLAGNAVPPSDEPDVDVNGKRKRPPLPTGHRFKAVGNMVLAMKRFQASLNPTVTFGKPASSAGGSSVTSSGMQGAEATSAPRGPLDPANQRKLQRTNTPNSRNRMAILLQPLPPAVDA